MKRKSTDLLEEEPSRKQVIVVSDDSSIASEVELIEDNVDQDLELARRLQEEEYTVLQPSSRLQQLQQLHALFGSLEEFRDDFVHFNEDNYAEDDIDLSYEGLLALGERIGDAKPKPSIKASVVNKLPKQKVDTANSGSCTICMEEYKVKDVKRLLPCEHDYHDQVRDLMRVHQKVAQEQHMVSCL